MKMRGNVMENFNILFLDFDNKPGNLRIGLSTNGMNPYGNLCSKPSSWSILLVIYNLSPWLCMKCKYMILSMMIFGPRKPGNDIDDEGIEVFDKYNNHNFKIFVVLFCTINDFLAYENLSKYNYKGHKACRICEEGTSYHQLTHGRKTYYLGHCKFLKASHSYRQLNFF
ncbi:hypothetical protein CR513_09499, partial [Mucuna pruriens]